MQPFADLLRQPVAAYTQATAVVCSPGSRPPGGLLKFTPSRCLDRISSPSGLVPRWAVIRMLWSFSTSTRPDFIPMPDAADALVMEHRPCCRGVHAQPDADRLPDPAKQVLHVSALLDAHDSSVDLRLGAALCPRRLATTIQGTGPPSNISTAQLVDFRLCLSPA